MGLKHNLYIAQCIILCIIYNYGYAEAMVGVNVRVVHNGEFNYVVAIKKINNENPNLEKDYLCTGTLISKKDVLTLEHCFSLCSPDRSEVIVGSPDLNTGKKFYPQNVITYYMWAVYKKLYYFQKHDIAVVKLKEAVPDEIKPVALSKLKYPFINGLDIVAAGWGENNSGKVSPLMETVNLKVLSSIECIKKLNTLQVQISILHIKYLCATAEPYAIMCGGNSGSPILHMGELIAIHQGTCPFPDEPYNKKKINLNLSIDYFRNFISDAINNNINNNNNNNRS